MMYNSRLFVCVKKLTKTRGLGEINVKNVPPEALICIVFNPFWN
ncbi:hypothetical protein NZNM25_03220 [Nitrosopumilus zosterae]|uniref:Uncharacterized protein n=1 Tax=Nitrosopumilus zosterae TaxID=718286 RepID=A0A2S2KPS4_9ARCH|nr:hypothetical protein [Nitrosopumilus zosterae]GBH33531.1 hypothetical protein NZNM25_03220 [Nitrosopumilus zosterae]